jgi:hypothetical protein
MMVPQEGRLPWRRLLWSLFGALLVVMVGFIALLANVSEPGPLLIAIETIALPFVRLVYWASAHGSGPAVWLPVASSILVWWAIFFAFLTRRARRRNAHPAG